MKKLLLSISLMLVCSVGFSQGTPPELPTVIQPSPEARKIQEYGNVPVKYNTGIPSIQVPIYSFQAGGQSYPISLSYHGGGVRVGESEGMTGLKWTLTDGAGRISRSVRGRPDEDNVYNNSGWLTSGAYVSNLDITQLTVSEQSQIKNGCWDLEPDVFNLMLPDGRSIKFMFNENGQILLMPISEDFKIEYTSNLSSWTVTDNKGVKYYFATPESTKVNSGCSPWQPVCNDPSKLFPTSWMLDKVVLLDNSEITYTYVNEQYLESSWTDIKLRKTTSETGWGNATRSFCNVNTHYSRKKLITITYEKTKVNYSYSLKNTSVTAEGSKLDEIYVTYNNQHVKKIRFDYYMNPHQRMFLERVKEISKLNTEQILNQFEYQNKEQFPNRNSVAIDHFGYFNGSSSSGQNYATQIIAPNDDFYINVNIGNVGVNRTLNANMVKYGSLTKIIYPTKGYSVFEYEPNEVYKSITPEDNQVNVQSTPSNTEGWEDHYSDYFSLPSTKTFTITSINISNFDNLSNNVSWTRPTVQLVSDDGQVYYSNNSFNFGENITSPYTISNLPDKQFRVKIRVYNSNSVPIGVLVRGNYPPASQEQNIYYGGLRVKSITNYDHNAIQAYKKSFNYNKFDNTNQSSGETSLSLPSYFKKVKEPVFRTNGVGITYISSWNNFDEVVCVNPVQVDMVNSTPVYYRNVKEIFEDSSSSYHIKRTFRNYGVNFKSSLLSYQIGSYYMTMQTPSTFESYANGVLESEEMIDSSGRMVSKIEYEKEFLIADGIDIQKVQCINYAELPYQCFASEYPTISRWFVNKKTTNTVYNTNGDLITTTEIFYDNPSHKLPTRQFVTNSKGETIITTTKYPHDLNNTRLINDYRIAEVLQTETSKKVGATTTKLASQKNIFNDFAFYYLLEKNQTSKNNQAFEDRIVFHSYNGTNPIEVSKKDGPKVRYVWGYEGNLPIAKIEGYTSVSTTQLNTIRAAVLESNNDVSTSDEAQLRTALNNLRNAFPEAQVTTYTYDPLIGITSITDPRGEVVYYEYDEFNRLRFVKNTQGQILKEHTYNYKN
ncbi:YD repeat-containing protein [Tenacibaculum skagerrakense]|uniref:YD repeat-containing protein n=1 Tax=Tenacibaculum skagerrakense TaxID=186571 RepID=A0A4R2P2P2_9FLAO|nr:RHS repeat protein [Tenacibaculum skagerrakense]TCP27965.1 YD repeat-containing protein [Tenacibaculum skagerrakense]